MLNPPSQETEPNLPKSNPVTLHREYCFLCGIDPVKLPLTMSRLWAVELFCLHFTIQDLRDLVKHIKSKGQKGRSLLFRNLISGPDSIAFAQEDIAEYKAKHRHAPMDKGKAAVLRATGRTTESQPDAKPASEIIGTLKTPEEMKAFFERCKREAGL